jgi:flagellar biogenesis protein FliO
MRRWFETRSLTPLLKVPPASRGEPTRVQFPLHARGTPHCRAQVRFPMHAKETLRCRIQVRFPLHTKATAPRTAQIRFPLFTGGTLRRGFSIARVFAKCALVIGMIAAISTTWAQDSPDALAPGAFGTRAGAPVQRVVSPDASSSGWAQLGLALLIVAVGLRWGLPRLMRWAGKTGDGSPLDGQIRIIETRSAVGGSLMLVKARDKLLLIGATPQGMHLLADLTDTLPKSEPVSLAESAFERVLRTARPVASLPDLQQEAAAHVQSRLRQTRARLQSLLGGQP